MLFLCRLKIQVWDADYISADDAIAEGVLDLREFYARFYSGHEQKPAKEISRSWIALTHSNENDATQSRLEISIELLTLDEANHKTNGFGRDEPNAHPFLAEPKRPEISRIVPWRPDLYAREVRSSPLVCFTSANGI
jgi:hypothetical protein